MLHSSEAKICISLNTCLFDNASQFSLSFLLHDAFWLQGSVADKTPYTIMFGPDKCGNDDKLHFIFRHKHPKTGEFEVSVLIITLLYTLKIIMETIQ